MIYYISGITAFGLFLIYDINSVVWQKRSLHRLFFLGSVLLIGSSVFLFIKECTLDTFTFMKAAAMIPAVFFLILLIYTLFFALPFGDTYQSIQGKPQVCTTGVYALCRHPGVLWFFFFYISLAAALSSLELGIYGIVLSICNLLYVILQDCWTFPHTLYGYPQYKQSTPFLFPDRDSIRKFKRDLHRNHK